MSCRWENLRIILILLIIIQSVKLNAQDSSAVKNNTGAKSINVIPHSTAWEKWMWVHRCFAFEITKERPVDYDTAYINTYYKQLVITIPISTRFLQFSLIDLQSGKKLTFAPNITYDLGISVSSRWASFIVNTGVKVYSTDEAVKGKTKYRDYQLNIYGRKITTDMFLQYYSGFYIRNSESFNNYKSSEPYSIRPDVNATQLGASTYYIVNYKKFSYRNSFAFVEQQKKSSGSLLLGVYYSYFAAQGMPSLITPPFRSSFDTLSFIRSGHTNNFGLNLGYIYTLVFLKKCYATASLVQGVGGEQISFKRDDNTYFHKTVAGAGKLNVRLALGYDSGKYFIGTMAMFDYFLFRGNTNSTFDYSFGKFMAYIGYRFSYYKTEHKVLHRLKLIDY